MYFTGLYHSATGFCSNRIFFCLKESSDGNAPGDPGDSGDPGDPGEPQGEF